MRMQGNNIDHDPHAAFADPVLAGAQVRRFHENDLQLIFPNLNGSDFLLGVLNFTVHVLVEQPTIIRLFVHFQSTQR